MAKLGRHTKCTPELVKQITDHLSGGMNRKDTCLVVGINQDTFYTWINEKPEFSEQVEKAEAVFKGRNIALIQRAAVKQWQAAAWLLERKYNKEFALHQFNTIEVADDSALTDDRIAELLTRGLKNLPAQQLESVLIEVKEVKPDVATPKE